MPTMMSVPTMPLANPPPVSDGLPGGVSVMNPQSSACKPWMAT